MFQNLELNSLPMEVEISNLKHQFGVLLEPRPTAHGFWQNSVSVNRLFNTVLKFPNTLACMACLVCAHMNLLILYCKSILIRAVMKIGLIHPVHIC